MVIQPLSTRLIKPNFCRLHGSANCEKERFLQFWESYRDTFSKHVNVTFPPFPPAALYWYHTAFKFTWGGGGWRCRWDTIVCWMRHFFCQLMACTARGHSGQRALSHADTGFRHGNEPAQVRNHSMEGETVLTLETRKICALVKLYNARVSKVLVR